MSSGPLDRLSQFPIGASLSSDDRAKLAAIATLESHSLGITLFVEGDPSDSVYVVVEGRIDLTMRRPGRPDATLLTLGPGDLVGWSALTSDARRVASAHVGAPAVLVRLPRAPLLALCEQDHDIGYSVTRLAFAEVGRRLHETRLQLLDMYGATR